MTSLFELLNITKPVSVIIISISLMMLSGFLMTRLTKIFHLPAVTGYIIAGIILGPYVLNVVPETMISGMDFIADISLSFIAFSTGEFFQKETLKRNGMKVVVITLFESLLASFLVFLVSYYVLGLERSFSLILGALASATAPASTVMTIRQTGAKGDFVDTLLQVVALDDVVALVAFSLSLSLSSTGGDGLSFKSVITPLVANTLVFILGGLFGYLLKLLLHNRSTDNRLIVTIAMLFTFCGICTLFDVSPLLGCMSMGMIYINATGDSKLFKQINYFSPPILLLFFVRSGLNFNISSLFSRGGGIEGVSLMTVGVVYFFVRIIGKYAGAFIGCLTAKKDKKVVDYLGLALIPQAGVAIGLSALGRRVLGGEGGEALETIILASSVLYELIGPAAAKLALYLSHSYSTKLEEVAVVENTEGKSDTELLIERIHKIQEELEKKKTPLEEDEEAFSEGAYETEGLIDRRRKENGKLTRNNLA